MANLNFFRSACTDDGTAYECGYADALGIPVYGYLDDRRDLASRMRAQAPEWVQSDWSDRYGWKIEDFGLPLNLIFRADRLVIGSPRDCLERIRQDIVSNRFP